MSIREALYCGRFGLAPSRLHAGPGAGEERDAGLVGMAKHSPLSFADVRCPRQLSAPVALTSPARQRTRTPTWTLNPDVSTVRR
jgi:hypothetical protein